MYETLKFELTIKTSMKTAIIFHVLFEKDTPNASGSFDSQEYCIRKKTAEIRQRSDIPLVIRACQANCERRIDDFIEMGSGWGLQQFLAIDLEIGQCPPLNGA
jgi:hypothetical protein